MIKNHIHLLMHFNRELMKLARAQDWVTAAQAITRNSPAAQKKLDDYRRDIVMRKIKLQDRMFEIQRSN